MVFLSDIDVMTRGGQWIYGLDYYGSIAVMYRLWCSRDVVETGRDATRLSKTRTLYTGECILIGWDWSNLLLQPDTAGLPQIWSRKCVRFWFVVYALATSVRSCMYWNGYSKSELVEVLPNVEPRSLTSHSPKCVSLTGGLCNFAMFRPLNT